MAWHRRGYDQMVGLVKTHQISAAAHRVSVCTKSHWLQAVIQALRSAQTHVDNGPSVYNLEHLWIFSTRDLTLFLLSVITTAKILLHLKVTEYVNHYVLFHARNLKLPQKKSTSFCSQQLTFILIVFWHLAVANYWLHSLPWSTFLL